MKKIRDFGDVIPGARRDFYNGITLEALEKLSNSQLSIYVKKDKVFPWSREMSLDLIKKGQTPFLVYWKLRMRRMIAATPKYDVGEDYRQVMMNYVSTCNLIHETLDSIVTENQIPEFYDIMRCLMSDKSYEWRDVKKEIAEDNSEYIREQFENSDFLNETQKTRVSKKKKLQLPVLKVVRNGTDYRTGRNIKDYNWIRLFGFKGVQFGNWLNQIDRQNDMNNCYDAFMDLAKILHVSAKSLSLDGTLAIAFGSRGKPGAAAHYEPGRHVINLTKEHGAGSLAHEWFHALDHYIAIKEGFDNGKLATNIAVNGNESPVLNCLRKLIQTMRYDDKCETKFYTESMCMDGEYTKEGHGYWTSEHEMAARAFACYCHKKMKSTYLSGHALSSGISGHKPYPIGLELFKCNLVFDELFALLKEQGYLEEMQDIVVEPIKASENGITTIWSLEEETDGQMVYEPQNMVM